MHKVYLDNSSTTRPKESVLKAMRPYFTDDWGAVGAPHDMGQDLWPRIEKDYKALYDLISAKEADDLILTSCGAEAVNHVLMSCYFDLTRESGQNHFITSNCDEAPVIMGIGRLEHLGCVGKMIPVGSKGYVSKEDLLEAITPRTALVSFSAANALTGVMNPVAELASLCEERGIYLHLELSQLVGRSHIDVGELGAELVSFNGDHLHGPKGTGVLWMKRGTELSPFILGGSDQAGRRAGTLNTPGLAGLAQAAREAQESLDHVSLETARLRDRFETEVERLMPEAQICFRDAERVPTTSCIAFPGVSNEALMYALNKRGVYASMGGGGVQQIALLLTAAGFDEEVANCAVSFSLSGETTDEEIDYALSALDESLHHLKRMSAQCYE